MTERTFEYKDAELGHVSLLLSLVGPSFSGKTNSALRLATGIRQVTGGDIALIDTENGRATHYADEFKFKHLPFPAPFDPDSYLAALETCSKQGAKVVIVDSGSHCWESAGGVLESHETELDRMAGNDWKKRERMNFAAWIKPKRAYNHLVNTMLQMNIHMIWCFRAKQKTSIKKGEKPANLGFMSIAGSEMMYEFHLQALLYPSSGGVPTWNSELPGERMMAKLPRQFEHIFKQSQPLSEDIGQQLAEWAAGDSKPAPPVEGLELQESPSERLALVLAMIDHAPDRETLTRVAAENKDKDWEDAERATIRDRIKLRMSELSK